MGKIWLFPHPVSLILWKENWNHRLLGCLPIETSTLFSLQCLTTTTKKCYFFLIFVLRYNIGQNKPLWCDRSEEAMLIQHICRMKGTVMFMACLNLNLCWGFVINNSHSAFQIPLACLSASSDYSFPLLQFTPEGQTGVWERESSLTSMLAKWVGDPVRMRNQYILDLIDYGISGTFFSAPSLTVKGCI